MSSCDTFVIDRQTVRQDGDTDTHRDEQTGMEDNKWINKMTEQKKQNNEKSILLINQSINSL